MPSSTFPTNSHNNYSGSISPPNSGLTTGGNILYPTIVGGGNNSNSNNPSPLPSVSRKTPESFLGENFSNLVNLDKLVTEPKSNKKKKKNQFSFYFHLFLQVIQIHLVQQLHVLKIHLLML